MELVKNIFFNTDKLVENSKIKISYTGKFFQDNSEKVSIHYGFGNNWNNLTSTQMVKTELGYQIEIEIGEVETFNFCFCNEKNEWDNNDGKNYIFIEKMPEKNWKNFTCLRHIIIVIINLIIFISYMHL